MILGQKILLYPSPEQVRVFNKSFGVSRYAYNWALTKWKEQKALGIKSVKMNDLKKEWNQIKPDWVYDCPKDANQRPFADLSTALKNYFTSKNAGNKNFKFPRKKKRGKCRDSFYVSNDRAHITNNHIKLPLVGRVKLAEGLRFKKKHCRILSYTVSRTADKYYVSVNYEIPDALGCTKSESGMVGIDLGLKTFAVESSGHEESSPRALKKHQQKLVRLQRKLSRASKGSIRRKKTKMKLAKQHARISNIRKDHLHKYSRKIVNENAIIVFEDLNIRGMLKNHKLARAIADSSWSELVRMTTYKAMKSGSIVLKADRFFPSSKLCSECGALKHHIGLDEREYICEECGCIIDRDLNASINILAYGLFQLIPSASGKFTSVEIVALAQRAIGELTMVNEAFLRSEDGRWNSEALVASLRNKVELSLAIQP